MITKSIPDIKLGDDFKTFLSQVKLRDEMNQSIAQFIQVPEKFQDNSIDEMFQMTENLYNTYTQVLTDYNLNSHIRDLLKRQLLQVKGQIDDLERKLYGDIIPPITAVMNRSKKYPRAICVEKIEEFDLDMKLDIKMVQ
ncbi:Hypothetical_protein [Hexamita inflata]|uniref:Hypothetical_protein n=1 Tax=Hexamita inflata TaxID=28002 RepID=A0AA86TVZ9_9EUKA|nr:Hypothetical protein HINF_LOCUS18735 [Hexamita inflata]